MGGHQVDVGIFPCSWMYPTMKAAVGLTLNPTGQLLRVSAEVHFTNLTEAMIDDLVAELTVGECEKSDCSNPRFGDAYKHNRGTMCESCFVAKIEADYAVATQRRQREQVVREQAHYYSGMRWKVVAWIHPETGDDYTAILYFSSKPSSDFIRTQICAEKSQVLDVVVGPTPLEG